MGGVGGFEHVATRGVQLRAVKVVEAAPAGAAPAGDVKV
jgi:hypothetical protein